eukprot:6076179-Pyramimonas_sp.AAC.1
MVGLLGSAEAFVLPEAFMLAAADLGQCRVDPQAPALEPLVTVGPTLKSPSWGLVSACSLVSQANQASPPTTTGAPGHPASS